MTFHTDWVMTFRKVRAQQKTILAITVSSCQYCKCCRAAPRVKWLNFANKSLCLSSLCTESLSFLWSENVFYALSFFGFERRVMNFVCCEGLLGFGWHSESSPTMQLSTAMSPVPQLCRSVPSFALGSCRLWLPQCPGRESNAVTWVRVEEWWQGSVVGGGESSLALVPSSKLPSRV